MKDVSDDLLMDHQQEDVVSGGLSTTIQWHYLLSPDVTVNTSSTVVPAAKTYDANEGAAGSASTNFGLYENRRDFAPQDRGF